RQLGDTARGSSPALGFARWTIDPRQLTRAVSLRAAHAPRRISNLGRVRARRTRGGQNLRRCADRLAVRALGAQRGSKRASLAVSHGNAATTRASTRASWLCPAPFTYSSCAGTPASLK